MYIFVAALFASLSNIICFSHYLLGKDRKVEIQAIILSVFFFIMKTEASHATFF
jgi:hypothetical protein